MSLINQVLRDLDRQAGGGESRPPAEVTAFPAPPPVPQSSTSHTLWLTLAAFVLGALVAGVLAWQAMGRDGASEGAAPDLSPVETAAVPAPAAEEAPSVVPVVEEPAPTVSQTDTPMVTKVSGLSTAAAQPSSGNVGSAASTTNEEVPQGPEYIPLIVKPDSPENVVPLEPQKTQLKKPRKVRARKPVVKSRPAVRKRDSFTRAKRFLDAGRISEAEAALQEALKIQPGNVQARNLLAGLMLRGGRLEEAMRLLDEGLRLKPNDAGLAILKGRLLMEARDDEEALALLERTLPEGREGKQHLAMLGALYQRQGQHRRALGSFERLLTFDPRNASAWAGSGISLEALQEPQRAQQAYQRALSLPGLSPVVRRYAQGRFDALKAK